jgi:hypothetical protein
LEAVVLGGGYGRGEGGVLKTNAGEQPYNDLDFYVFLRDGRFWQKQGCQTSLQDLGDHLSVETGVHVEFKIDGLARWVDSPVSMFSYDLVCGHRVVFGDKSIFQGLARHRDAAAIPLSEATRLMFNRCSGLLLARELLQKRAMTPDESDFVGRNLAKMQLALGDAVLTAFGKYHWSARERQSRLASFATDDSLPWLAQLQQDHAAGLEFKLHPRRLSGTVDEFSLEHRRLAGLALQVWLWLESRRLKQSFLDAADYALSVVDKCPGMPPWRNYLLSLRTFGLRAAMDAVSWRYPRERLFRALTLLLWNAEELAHPRMLRRLQQDLHTDAPDWNGLVGAFKQIWPRYG